MWGMWRLSRWNGNPVKWNRQPNGYVLARTFWFIDLSECLIIIIIKQTKIISFTKITSLSLQIFQSRLSLNRVYRRLIARGDHKVFFREGSTPTSSPLSFYVISYAIFRQKRYIPSLDKINGTPFTSLVVKFFFPFNYCALPISKSWIQDFGRFQDFSFPKSWI